MSTPAHRFVRPFAAAVLTVAMSLSATRAVAQDDLSIPDTDLRLCLTRSLDLAPDAPVSATAMGSLLDLNCNQYKDLRITDLSGLEHLTGADALHLGAGDITDLTPLSALAGLTAIYVENNAVRDLTPLTALPNLKILYVSGNPIVSVEPVAHMPALKVLDLHSTEVSDAHALAASTTLRCVTIGDSPASDYLFLAGMEQLTCLIVTDLGITSLAGIGVPPHLRAVQLHAPLLRSLDGLESATELEELEASAMQLPGVEIGDLSDISALAGLRRLTQVNLDHNRISDISALGDKPVLHDLLIDTNQISDLGPLASSTGLKRIWLGSNRISTLAPLSGMHELAELRISGNDVASLEPLRGLPLVTFEATRNQISDVEPLSGTSTLRSLYMSRNRITDASPLAQLAGEPVLVLDQNRIHDLSAFAAWTGDVWARDQVLFTADGSGNAGSPVPLGIRNQVGEAICGSVPTADVSCTAGLMTYPTAGTWTSAFSDLATTGSVRFSGTVSQHVGPDAVFNTTYAPVPDTPHPLVGYLVAADTRTWTPAVTSYTYQWRRDRAAIPGDAAQRREYVPVAADRGHQLSVCVVGHLNGYEARRRCSTATARVGYGALHSTPRPKVTGTAATGETLTAATGTWDDGVTLHYQWQKNKKNIKGATTATYTLRAGDVGDRIRVRVKAPGRDTTRPPDTRRPSRRRRAP